MVGGMLGVVWSGGFQFLALMIGSLLEVPITMSNYGDGDMLRGWQTLTESMSTDYTWITGA
jgi:hypothetical protein